MNCAYCGNPVKRTAGHINLALKLGKPIHCDRICYGLRIKKEKSAEQKKAEKSEYDKRYGKQRWAKERYGEFKECFLLLREMESEIRNDKK